MDYTFLTILGRNLYVMLWMAVWITCQSLVLQPSSSVVSGSDGRDTANSTSFCQGDLFKASCGSDDVIYVKKAHYGRIRISRCVKENFGYVGCSSSVIEILDSICSGRHDCTVKILDESFPNVNSCHEDLKSYLEVAYQCIKVTTKPWQVCKALKPVTLRETSGYIASVVSIETGCGAADAPWIIEVLPGQKVNITLIDFGIWKANSSGLPSVVDPFSRVCRVYATIREAQGSRSVTVCGGERRHRPVYISQEHRVEVRLINTKTTNQPANFLLHYQAIGCSNVEKPSGGWIKRGDEVTLLGCNESSFTWQLKCVGTAWVGEAHNCTQVPLKVTKAEPFSLASLPLGMSIVIVVALALVIGLLILAIGVFCIRRNHDDADDTCQETRSIMLGDRTYDHAHMEPKHTIVCSMHGTPREALVTRLKDGTTLENDYSGTRLLQACSRKSGYCKDNEHDHICEPSQCLDILHSPNIMRQHAHLCNGNPYSCSRPGRERVPAQYCDDLEVHYEVERSKLLGLDETPECSNHCDNINSDTLFFSVNGNEKQLHCNKCGLRTFGKTDRSTEQLDPTLLETEERANNNVDTL